MGRKSSGAVVWPGARGVGRFGAWLGSRESHFGADEVIDGEMLRHNEETGGGRWRYGETRRRNGETWKHGETAEGIGGKHEEYGENGGTGEYGETDGEKCEKIGSHPYWTGKGFLPTF